MKFKTLVAGVACFSAIFATALQAQAPQMFRYQGRLLDNDTLVSGDLNFNFKLYSAPTGGAALYEDAATVTVVDGLYSTMIGDDTTSGGDLGDALKNSAVYLEITVGGETLAPRERIVSVPYAMNDNGLPSGTVVLSATNPNPALEAQGYSLVYSDVTSPADWAVSQQNELVIPFNSTGFESYRDGLVSFGDYVGFLSDGSNALAPFFYSRDGIVWSESTPPIVLDSMVMEEVVLNDILYLLTSDMKGALLVATTSNGADWEELTVSVPVANISSLYEVQAFANQIWLFGSTNTVQEFILKSSDGTTWTSVTQGAWDSGPGLETVATPERLLVVANINQASSSYYIWTNSDEASWTQSSAVLPFGSGNGQAEITFANNTLWAFGTPEGQTIGALYQSTDWGDSWTPVSTDLPTISYQVGLGDLAAGSGLILSVEGVDDIEQATYISEDGSDWSKAVDEHFDEVTTSGSGQIWLFDDYVDAGSLALYSIGGPLRNGRFFYYQKD
jgi:hypothetical protein